MSGDLRDPQQSIPIGTILAQLTTSFVCILDKKRLVIYFTGFSIMLFFLNSFFFLNFFNLLFLLHIFGFYRNLPNKGAGRSRARSDPIN